jgi:hypothetical protein
MWNASAFKSLLRRTQASDKEQNMNIKIDGSTQGSISTEGSEKMLQFLSFVVTFALLGGLLAFIVITIRNASESVLKALGGQEFSAHRPVTFVTFDRPRIRTLVAPRAAFAPLRAAA